MNFSIFNLMFFLGIIDQMITTEWNYGEQGPDVWSDAYSSCAGHAQSPIDIRTACTIHRSFEPFEFSCTYNQRQSFTLINSGFTISGTLTNQDSSFLTLTGGGLEGTYEFSSFHFHSGENYKSGSEHQINSEKYSGELHLVHTNPITNQTAVLGIFLQSIKETNITENEDNPTNSLEWRNLFSSADDLERVDESITVNLNLLSLININFNKFWRYTGSLTTPPCTEGIIWTVFKQVINVNDNEFRFFRNDLYPKDYREPQPLYHRIIYRSFPHDIVPTIDDYRCCSRQIS